MSVKPPSFLRTVRMSRVVLAGFRQTLMVVLINIPTLSFGMAMGWVSLASGESVDTAMDAGEGEGGDAHMVALASVTFCASFVGVPLSALAFALGRKPALIAISALFMACWGLKMCGGGWWLVAARACAGVGGAGAWTLAPLLAREMCSKGVRGAAVSALGLANNLGILLMYIAADMHMSHRTLLWSCFLLSAVHCVVYLFVPESPQFLAAQGHMEKAKDSLAWLRGVDRGEPALLVELSEFAVKEKEKSPLRVNSWLKLIKDMFSEAGPRRAFFLCCMLVVAQEVCGVLALMHFAERAFVLARDVHDDAAGAERPADALGKPARHAVYLGTAQFVGSVLALYLVEKMGRKRLMVWCGVVTGASLAAGAAAVQWAAGGAWAAVALIVAVFADSAGLYPAPFAMMADMFDYKYRGLAVSMIAELEWLGNAVEVVVFPWVAARAGIGASLALSGALTLALTAYAQWRAPETRGRSTAQIYEQILGTNHKCDSVVAVNCNETATTKM